MWKESFRIGVELVDTQHKELFQKIGELLKGINASVEKNKQECIRAILFLKDYSVKHFAEEEAYQKSIGYPEFESHRGQHEKFIRTVLDHEKNMIKSDFDEKDVKEFTGMLIAWLLYHVADSDQKIGRYARKVKEAVQTETLHTHSDIIASSAFDVLTKMAGLDEAVMKKAGAHDETFDDSVAIEIELAGDISGYITYAYPVSFVKGLVNAMMGYTPEAIDDLEISVLFELSNIISGNACGHIANEKGILCDIKPPFLTNKLDVKPEESVALDTGIGIVGADIVIEYH